MSELVLDHLANLDIRDEMSEYTYPNLFSNPRNYEAISGYDNTYNCISHSLDIYDEWIWPEWDAHLVETFDDLYAEHGYVPLEDSNLDYSLVSGFEKAALFVSSVGFPTHAMKQEQDGSWTSKNGPFELIKCTSPNDLAGGSYGHPCKVYIRPIE